MTDVRFAHARMLLLGLVFLSGVLGSGCSGCGDTAPGGVAVVDTGVPVDEDGSSTGDADGVDTGSGDGGPLADVGGADGGVGDGGADPTDPNNNRRDTDCDGLSDAEEFGTLYLDGQRTNPNNPDTDGDGLSDGLEVGRTMPVAGSTCATISPDADPMTRTSPVVADTDGDGIPDGVEDASKNGKVDGDESDPTTRDTDGDRLPDDLEDANKNGVRDPGELNPARRDTDGDGISDGVEDANRNGMLDSGETDPRVADTDGDGLADGAEDTNHDGVRQSYETDPRTADTDCDGVSDGSEVRMGTSPLVTDSDGDGLDDGVELGVTAALPGTSCRVSVDRDPQTMTRPGDADTDADGLVDGVEDANHNGRRDAGETDPNNPDTDGDGINDGDERIAGTDPLDPRDPASNVVDGINRICDDQNLKVVNFNVGGREHWTLATEQTTTYRPITLSAAAVNTDVAALDGATSAVSAFVLRMPVIAGGAMTSVAQNTAYTAQLGARAAGENFSMMVRTSPRHISSHDGFETAVSGVVDFTATTARETAVVRNALLRMSTGLLARDFTGLPTTTPGPSATQFVFTYQLLVRTNPGELIVVGAVLSRAAYDSTTANSSIEAADLTNGTALARAGARHGKDCNRFVAGANTVADFLWMADVSGSTDDDRGRIINAAQQVFNALRANGVDFRMGVVRHDENDLDSAQSAPFGELRGMGFTTDLAQFQSDLSKGAMENLSGCEFGLDAVREAMKRALPRSAMGATDRLKFRSNAQIAVVYISDEYAQELTEGECAPYAPHPHDPDASTPNGAACSTGIRDIYRTGDNSICTLVPNASQQDCINRVVNPYIAHLMANGAIAFGQIIAPAPNPLGCNGYACPQPGSQAQNEPGLGYVEVINATGGTFYSPCVDNPGGALQSIIDAVTGAASQYQLEGPPISSTIKVGIVRVGPGGDGSSVIVPRDKDDGFDYDPVANSIFFRGTTRPRASDLVVVSYRLWLPPGDPPCDGRCTGNQVCDPVLQVCGCDQAACNACGPNQVCNDRCECACSPDCNGRCGADEVCNTQTCTCECAPNCGGACPTGTVCDPTSCACVCDTNCGGACNGTGLECNAGACNCQCPADCGGACGSGSVCNPSTCSCTCASDCSSQCAGKAVCDPTNNCECKCPADCGGCPDNTVCDPTSCACQCPADCRATAGCINRQQCDPANGCGCYCPADCGGCGLDETCDSAQCRCIPRL